MSTLNVTMGDAPDAGMGAVQRRLMFEDETTSRRLTSLEQKSELLVEVKEAEEPPSLAFAFVSGLTKVSHVLREGRKFIAKTFCGKDTSPLYCQVLQLWLERKILPEYVLRPFMDDIV
ncbi:uncharacterized protein LOC133878790 [Alnus glutinosa]|uniref:uncharacterized protein LOC133878790 n=1 Tax=Alnus glutinosa TaxID=3517 RepID=UPI002D7717A5|nr:uncharacterized protein LOC133878790 [Alnus glutinosa]